MPQHPIEPKGWVDRLVEYVSPRRAAARYEARARIEVARSMPVASYRGAVATRTGTAFGPSTSYRGGRTGDRRDLALMRDRARRAYFENPIAGALLDTETDNIVADGFSLQMRSASPDFNREAEERFYWWLEVADVDGQTSAGELFRTSWTEPRKDGDGGFVLIKRGGFPKLQYIPGDLIGGGLGPSNGRTRDGTVMFDGVECDPAGRPVRFHVRDVDETGKDTTAPIDARDFVYLSHRIGKNDVRGATCYRSVFGLLDQIDAYVDAVVIAARMACVFGLIRKSTNPHATLNALATAVNSQGRDQKAITLENGMLNVMGTDEEMVQVQAQQPMTQTPDFIRAMFRLICLPFRMPLEIGMNDLSQVNFSGGRIGLIAYYRSCRAKQDWLKSKCWNRIAFWWLSVERERQELGYPDAFRTPFPADYGAFELHGREWDYNDPVSEAQADLLEVSTGLKSPQQAAESRGRDWRETVQQIAEARKVYAALGIPYVLSSLTRDEVAKPVPAAPAPSPSPPPQSV